MTMDKRTRHYCLCMKVLYFYCLLVLVKACQLDNGDFYTVITVNEETRIGAVVGSLQFADPDSVLTITVEDDNPYFDYVAENNTFIVKSRIDIDQGLNTAQIMILQCMPQAGPKLEIEVEFELKDINDFSPEFRPSNEYAFRISEAAVIGTQIGVVDAKDRDIKNAYVTYELENSTVSGLFELKTVANGKAQISLRGTLDYETNNSYHLTVIAKDCQDRLNCQAGQNIVRAEVIIEVEDADDLSPEFNVPAYRVSIFEDATVGTSVVQLVARDQDDLNDPVRYSINGEGSQYFSVDPNTGLVTVADTNGIVRGRQYLLQARAWQVNDDTKRTTASLVIKIQASNGNAPKFTEKSYEITILEGSPVNTTALTFTATDIDLTSQLQFVLIEVPQNFPFQLRVTGWDSADLVISSRLDYESVKEYSAAITVSDGESTSRAEVRISVLNENDHNPAFEKESYEFTVDYQNHAVVGTIKATDIDSPNDGNPVTYRILPPHEKLFAIDEQGQITLIGGAGDYKMADYLINVQAMDKGSSPRSATTSIRIHISNISAEIPTTAASSGDQEDGNKMVLIYVISSIAGVLLIVVAILVMCALKRKAKKTAAQLKSKDLEHKSYDAPYAAKSTDTLKSATDSQLTYNTQTTVAVSEDTHSQSALQPVRVAEKKDEQDNNRNLQSYHYKDVHPADLAIRDSATASNDLSQSPDHEYIEMPRYSSDENTNIPAPTKLSIKSNSDSGRSSMREDRSPYMKRVPFSSFQHVKSSSIDETGQHTHDQEVALHTKRLVPVHSNSFNVSPRRHDITNVRATQGPSTNSGITLSHHSLNSGYIAEAPEGFRSGDSYRGVSPYYRTSDYESNTPTPEITNSSIIDYSSTDREHKPRLPMRNNSHRIAESHYNKQHETRGISGFTEPRSETPCSDVSTETDSVVDTETSVRPQMTIYF